MSNLNIFCHLCVVFRLHSKNLGGLKINYSWHISYINFHFALIPVFDKAGYNGEAMQVPCEDTEQQSRQRRDLVTMNLP